MKDQILIWLQKNRPADKSARARVIRTWQKEEENKKKRTNMVRISPMVMRRRRI